MTRDYPEAPTGPGNRACAPPGGRPGPAASAAGSTGRILFANHLRGLAALAVATSHLIGVFWVLPGLAADATATPLLQAALPWSFALVADPRLQLGPVGVATFFLVSGFVIPLSLGRHTRAGFLVARALRIYPTYVAALALQMLVLAADAHLWGRAFPYTAAQVLANATLFENYLGVPSLDLVNWTLGVELKFYLVMALAAPLLRAGSVGLLLGIAAAAIGLNAAIGAGAGSGFEGSHAGLVTAASYDSLYIVFMTIGVAFSYHQRGLLRLPGLLVLVPALGALFLGCWWISRIAGQFPIVPENYMGALVVFALLYAMRRHVPRSRVLAAMAAISYPFYLLHVLVGFSLLKLLMLGAGLGYEASLAVTLGTVALLAWGLHVGVERPSIRLAAPLRLRREDPEGGAETMVIKSM